MADLTHTDRLRLTYFKWGYLAQAEGFTKQEAARLVFCKVLAQAGCYADDRSADRAPAVAGTAVRALLAGG